MPDFLNLSGKAFLVFGVANRKSVAWFVGRSLEEQGARVIALANQDDQGVPDLVSDCVFVPAASEYLLPILEVIPLQLFSYFMALEHGVDVDRPRNLSKAVVEK